jgi:hypothetical protein
MVRAGKAIGFVQTKGDDIEQARLISILQSKPPSESIMQKLAEMQNPDGGFAYWLDDKSASTISDTVWVLGWFDDLKIHDGIIVDAAIRFLFNHQKEDGGWDEVANIADLNLPPYLFPGKIETRVWLTAYCAHCLMLFGYAESSQCRGCPAEFLLKHREPSGRLVGYLRATWDALPIFAHYPQAYSEHFTQAMEVVCNEFEPQKWVGSYLTWLIRCFRDAGLQASHPLVDSSIKALIKKQRPDGSWDSEDGEQYAVSATIDALRVLKDYKII